MQHYVVVITKHAAKCGSEMKPNGEKREASVFYNIKFETSKKMKGPRGWECNLAAVWGQLSSGGGHRPLMNTMSLLVMTRNNYMLQLKGTLTNGGESNLKNPVLKQEKRKEDLQGKE